MQVLKSLKAPFRYLWRNSKSGPLTPSHVSATNVLVTNVNPGLVKFNVARMLEENQPMTEVGELVMDCFGESGSGRVRDILRSVLQPALGTKSIKYLSADYTLLCGGAIGFHHDMPSVGAVYVAWHLEGPDRVLFFPEMGLKIPFKKGTFVIFDPAQPHALLKEGVDTFDPSDYQSTDIIELLSISCSRTPTAAAAIGAEKLGVRKHAGIRTTPEQYQVCRTTGRLVGLPQ